MSTSTYNLEMQPNRLLSRRRLEPARDIVNCELIQVALDFVDQRGSSKGFCKVLYLLTPLYSL